MMEKKFDFSRIVRAFQLYGELVAVEPYGNGHINDTFAVTLLQAGTLVRYILQRINCTIFTDPAALMENVSRVTRHLYGKYHDSRAALQLVPTQDGAAYFTDADGNCWRIYLFIENATSFDVLETEKQAFEAAGAFGRFQSDLADLGGERLHETIPDFHNTPVRLAQLKEALKLDKCGRAHEVQPEIDFVLAREEKLHRLVNLQKDGSIPERVTHNDTKLNNVLIDDATGHAASVIDLDTVMPGLVHYDFGDMMRTGTSPAPEDERDLSKIFMRFSMFEALLRGYTGTAKAFLTEAEYAELPFSGILITIEIGIRFLADYLSGDIYFKTHRDRHNLDRARSQFQLASSMEKQYDDMMKLLKELKR